MEREHAKVLVTVRAIKKVKEKRLDEQWFLLFYRGPLANNS